MKRVTDEERRERAENRRRAAEHFKAHLYVWELRGKWFVRRPKTPEELDRGKPCGK